MKRFLVIFVILSFILVGCLDKFQAAKTVVSVVQIGLNSLNSIAVKIASDKKSECLKLGDEQSEAYKECYKKTAEMMLAIEKLKPQLEEALKLASAAIKAAEQKKAGEKIDFVTPIKHSVCLLTKLSTWLPQKYHKKIQSVLDLVGKYACDKVVENCNDHHNLYVLKRIHELLTDFVG